MSDYLNPESRIKVENCNADILFLAAKDDDCWPSDVAVPRMVRILEDNNYPHRVESKIYDKASNALVDGIDAFSGMSKFAFKKMIPAEKNYPEECELARRDSLKRIITFIGEWQ